MTTKKKVHDRGNPTYSLLQVMGALSAAGVLAWAILHYALAPEPAPTPMAVEVRLNNQCEIIDDAFMAAASNGAKAPFQNGVAMLETRSDAQVWISNSDKYPQFGFETLKVKAQPMLTIATTCQPNNHLDTTMDAMRQQFKSDK